MSSFAHLYRIGMSGEAAPRFIIPSVAHLQQENKVMYVKRQSYLDLTGNQCCQETSFLKRSRGVLA